MAALGVPPDLWTNVPAVAVPWGTVATIRLAEQLRVRFGLSHDEAQARAAIKLGLSEDTIRSRLKRFLRHAHEL